MGSKNGLRKGVFLLEKKKLKLLPRLLMGIVAGILLGSLGDWLGIKDSMGFQAFIKTVVTFTSLFSVFLNFIIPLLILTFVSVGLAELGKKANKLFGVTLLLAYLSTIIAGYSAFALGSAFLPKLIAKISGGAITGSTFDAFFTIKADPIFGVMSALILAFVLGLGLANIKEGQSLLDVLKDFRAVIAKVLSGVIIPIIPFYIAGTFCKIAAAGELVPTVIMFAKLYVMILCFQWIYILLQFSVASLYRKENRFKNLKNILPAYFTALRTQSSAATIPINLQCAETNGLSDDVRNFVIPLCATIHLAGDTICLVLGSMGIMIASGMTPTLAMFAPFILMLGVTMVAAPGVPGGGVMAALGIITSMLGFTDGMQELIIALHLSQDSFGTACNITGDQAIAAIIDRVDEKTHSKEASKAADSSADAMTD